MTSKPTEFIKLYRVEQNNLKGFDLGIPVGKLTVVTGLSGAGKSSLVFETLHAEGQRRYVETFSPYTRQFLDLLDRPKVERVENIRPSIAVAQSNNVKTSRSSVGTLTELCDYFKVWFAHKAELHDPAASEGTTLTSDHPQSVWEKAYQRHANAALLVCFEMPYQFSEEHWLIISESLQAQGYTRILIGGKPVRIDAIDSAHQIHESIRVIQDRIQIKPSARGRFIEAAENAFRLGRGNLLLVDESGGETQFFESLISPVDGRSYRPATPGLFSFNSPLGACPCCRGFGRIIKIDPQRVITDPNLSIEQGALKPFVGEVYCNCLRDLKQAAKKINLRLHTPWKNLNDSERSFVMQGDPEFDEATETGWYGVDRFFRWLEGKAYKMHVRVFLSKFRSYTTCPDCKGTRFQPETMNWRWQGHTLASLYAMSVDDLYALIAKAEDADEKTATLRQGILNRLSYLAAVGLGYLSLDRSSRTLSGGEMMRVNLTTCLGASLVDTLFVLDEPSVGLHARDLDALIGILRQLADSGNTVVVVEHDESVMRAADWLVEIGPCPGLAGGQLIYSGTFDGIWNSTTETSLYLSGRKTIPAPTRRPWVQKGKNATPVCSIRGAQQHNIEKLDIDFPLRRLVCVSGVSGSGKTTFLNNVLYQNLLLQKGHPAEQPAKLEALEYELPLGEIVWVDQSPVTKTPRSNAALLSGAWEWIRKRFAATDSAQRAGLTPGHFSFNSGEGRCETCGGLGYERIEMQFLSDVFVPCPTCVGKRFKPEMLAITDHGLSIADVLDLETQDGLVIFAENPQIVNALQPLVDVGLGYLKLGQPLNTLSGGESQRLKLVRYMGQLANADNRGHALLLIDEPTTGLHRADIARLLKVFHALVDAGHSLVVVEHNLDVLKNADWLIEFGPESGASGGRVVASGSPEMIARSATATGPFLAKALANEIGKINHGAAEDPASYRRGERPQCLEVIGAREHNLKNLSLKINYKTLNVITGVSGSGKSSLAFDIIFAEGQRRFMDSMSAYARQFVEQLPKADVDAVRGVAPTVAIEQRLTHGTRKSTVATITEIAQYLRLLYARIGIQYSPSSGLPVIGRDEDTLLNHLQSKLQKVTAKRPYSLCAELVRGRKGHHQPIADWARAHGYTELFIDGKSLRVLDFRKLDRYREHDVSVVIGTIHGQFKSAALRKLLRESLHIGKGTAYLLDNRGQHAGWLSTQRTDPLTGEAYPELDPKHFSWNSPKGWCQTCRGYGQLFEGVHGEDETSGWEADMLEGTICPVCAGGRLNPVSASVRLPLRGKAAAIALPELLQLTPSGLIKALEQVRADKRTDIILAELLPEIRARLEFMNQVGLDYLGLDRATVTLSGGEAQRIRLAAQLGSNLAGVLYILDEPSIGLHASDNEKLLQSMEALRDRGNTLIVVEHDEATMRRADCIFDLGPGAGVHGGELLARGTYQQILRNKHSLTGRYLRTPIAHPLRGAYRNLPAQWNLRQRRDTAEWLVLRGASLRNLKGFDLHLPLRRLSVVCGVSGAGKSTLTRDLLLPLLRIAKAKKRHLLQPKDLPINQRLPFIALHNGTAVSKIIEVDQSPIGKTPRSTPATYVGIFDMIRVLFANQPAAQARGFAASTFSFNTPGGRCESCKGAGRIKLEMAFMPNSYIACEDCGGRRFSTEILQIQWRGKNIADILEMTFEEAAVFFEFHTQLHAILKLMVETGLGYLQLGQSSPTLSGGEAQRLRLVSELANGMPSWSERQQSVEKNAGNNFYLLEEPTIGLHAKDCERLLQVLHGLVDQGHTVVVIEHHMDCIVEADYVIEIGPGGGDRGGRCLYQGCVDGLKKCKPSKTAPFMPKC
jgi:excinuclease ABC subunit A